MDEANRQTSLSSSEKISFSSTVKAAYYWSCLQLLVQWWPLVAEVNITAVNIHTVTDIKYIYNIVATQTMMFSKT